jgi:gas vesicle protein
MAMRDDLQQDDVTMTTSRPGVPAFLLGLAAGTFVGAGVAVWLAPRMRAEIRQRATDTASALGARASERYQAASRLAGDALDDLTRKGQRVRDDTADAVARGADEVSRRATALKSRRSTP